MSYIGSSATPLPVNFSAVQSQGFNGTGSQTTFTLNRSVGSVASVEVLVNNVQQSPYDGSYTVVGTTLTFSEAPSAGTNNVYVVYRDQAVGSLVDTTAYRKAEVDALLATKMPVNGPAFSAYQTNGQVLSSNVSTKVTFPLLDFDVTGGAYSTTTSRFTPLVAGYYQINASVCMAATETRISPTIFKNGSAYKLGNAPASASSASVSAVVYLNGSTDYVELYCILTAGQALSAAAHVNYFQGFLARSAT